MNGDRFSVNINTWQDNETTGPQEFLEVLTSYGGVIMLTAETIGGDFPGRQTIVLHPDSVPVIIEALQRAQAAYAGTVMADVRKHVSDVGRPERWVNPGFEAEHGRKPVAGVDYDPEGPMSGDEYAYYEGCTPYSQGTLDAPAEQLALKEQQAIHDHELDIVRHPDDPRW